MTTRKHSFEQAKGLLWQPKSYALTSEKAKNDHIKKWKTAFQRCFSLYLKYFRRSFLWPYFYIYRSLYCLYVWAEHDKSYPYGWRMATDLHLPSYSFSCLEMRGRQSLGHDSSCRAWTNTRFSYHVLNIKVKIGRLRFGFFSGCSCDYHILSAQLLQNPKGNGSMESLHST